MALPVVQNTSFPSGIDSFTDPSPQSPTAFGTSTDHALQHSRLNDIAALLEFALFGINNTANLPQGVPVLDVYGRNTTPDLAINVPMWTYGHDSVSVFAPNCTSGASTVALTSQRVRALSITSYALPSSRMLDVLFDLLGGYGGALAGAAWSTPKSGIVVLDAERNDFYNPTSSTSWGSVASGSLTASNFGAALQGCLVLIGSQSRQAASATTTRTGTWTTVNGPFTSGNCVSASVQSDSITYPAVTVPASGVLWHLGFVTTSPTGDTTVSINGATLGVASTGAATGAAVIQSLRPSSVNAPSSWVPQIIQIPNLTPGSSVSVTVTKTDASSSPIYADSLIVPQSSAPLIVVVLDAAGNITAPVPTSPASTWATQLGVGIANKPVYDSVINAITGPFANVTTVNLGTALNGHDMSYTNGYDLNDRGYRKFSDLICSALGAWLNSNDPDAIYQTL